MPTLAELHSRAFQHHQVGEFAEAEPIYRQILQLDAHHDEAWHLLGLLVHQTGRDELAVDYLRHAIGLKPDASLFHNNLGIVLRRLQRLDEAAASFREALRLQPAYADAHLNLGNTLREQGKSTEAGECYRQALRFQPEHAGAHNNLGNLLLEAGRKEEAIACYRQAVRFRPSYAEAHDNLGKVLCGQGQVDEAIASYRQALQHRPDYAEAHMNLGNALLERGELGEAVTSYRQAIRFRPDYPDALSNLGNAFKEQGQCDEAIACYQQALRLRPAYAVAHNNLAAALQEQGRLAEAAVHYREALRLDPNFIEPHSNLLFCISHDPSVTPEQLFAEHRRWAEQHAEVGAVSPHLNSPLPDRRLRIGYVSPDFRAHAVARFLEPILTNHDPTQVEIFCYARVRTPDAVTERLRSRAQAWRPISHLSEQQIVEQIRADQIDILVDLAGHTAGHRLRVFAHRPAPVQITYLGYPDTTGLTAIGYRLTDTVTDPPGELLRHTERLVRLPVCFSCYMPHAGAPEIGPLPALATGQITFGSLHRLVKLNPLVLDLWCQLVRSVPGSRLLLFRDSFTGSAAEAFRRQLEERGLDDRQFEFRHQRPPGGHLALYREIDIALDTFPWSGHTTACDALWMGVPVVTLRGNRHAGRMVTSALAALGRPEWIAESPAEYLAIASCLAGNLQDLAQIRAGLREQMAASPLCDGPRFTRELEAVYRDLWRAWVAGVEPR